MFILAMHVTDSFVYYQNGIYTGAPTNKTGDTWCDSSNREKVNHGK
jgi:hypothetical protein